MRGFSPSLQGVDVRWLVADHSATEPVPSVEGCPSRVGLSAAARRAPAMPAAGSERNTHGPHSLRTRTRRVRRGSGGLRRLGRYPETDCGADDRSRPGRRVPSGTRRRARCGEPAQGNRARRQGAGAHAAQGQRAADPRAPSGDRVHRATARRQDTGADRARPRGETDRRHAEQTRTRGHRTRTVARRGDGALRRTGARAATGAAASLRADGRRGQRARHQADRTGGSA